MCLRLRRDNPLRVDDPAGSTGRMDPGSVRLFRSCISDYPDHLQDTLYLIAHVRGFDAAIAALDQAIRAHLKDRVRRLTSDRGAAADGGEGLRIKPAVS